MKERVIQATGARRGNGYRDWDVASEDRGRKTQPVSTQIVLVIPEEHSFIAMVREMGRTLLTHHSTSAQDTDDLEVVVGELCANVTSHAHSESGYYRVTLEHHGDHVVLTVADGGHGFDPEQVPPVGTPRVDGDGTVRYGGYGLHLVGSLVDRLEFQRSHPCGTTVRAEKRLQDNARGTASST